MRNRSHVNSCESFYMMKTHYIIFNLSYFTCENMKRRRNEYSHKQQQDHLTTQHGAEHESGQWGVWGASFVPKLSLHFVSGSFIADVLR